LTSKSFSIKDSYSQGKWGAKQGIGAITATNTSTCSSENSITWPNFTRLQASDFVKLAMTSEYYLWLIDTVIGLKFELIGSINFYIYCKGR